MANRISLTFVESRVILLIKKYFADKTKLIISLEEQAFDTTDKISGFIECYSSTLRTTSPQTKYLYQPYLVSSTPVKRVV